MSDRYRTKETSSSQGGGGQGCPGCVQRMGSLPEFGTAVEKREIQMRSIWRFGQALQTRAALC
jgi:hypothetical protein